MSNLPSLKLTFAHTTYDQGIKNAMTQYQSAQFCHTGMQNRFCSQNLLLAFYCTCASFKHNLTYLYIRSEMEK